MDELGEGRRPSAAHPFFLPDEFLSVGGACVTEISRPKPECHCATRWRRRRPLLCVTAAGKGRTAGDEDEEGEESAAGLIQLPGSREVLEARLYLNIYIYSFFCVWRDTLTRSKHVVPYSQGIQTLFFFRTAIS